MPINILLVLFLRMGNTGASFEKLIGFKKYIRKPESCDASHPATMYDFWIKMEWYTEKPNNMIKIKKGSWEDKEVRKSAIEFFVRKVLKKEPKDVTLRDFNENMLYGLIKCYDNTPYKALLEAEMVTADDEAYMRRRGKCRFSKI